MANPFGFGRKFERSVRVSARVRTQVSVYMHKDSIHFFPIPLISFPILLR